MSHYYLTPTPHSPALEFAEKSKRDLGWGGRVERKWRRKLENKHDSMGFQKS